MSAALVVAVVLAQLKADRSIGFPYENPKPEEAMLGSCWGASCALRALVKPGEPGLPSAGDSLELVECVCEFPANAAPAGVAGSRHQILRSRLEDSAQMHLLHPARHTCISDRLVR